ncbi:hypothetical protein IFR05_006151 [Cadophora sp. M221]|nr:hypothetical protein IFR05_006151 [Cadophora sp. M221]
MLSMKLAVLAAFIGSALATPIASPDGTVKLAKRAEGVHLVNCGDRYSVVLYCANDGNCNFNPGPGDQCLPTNGGVQHWEGGTQKCTFPGTGTTFTWSLRSDAQQQKDYTQVGTGSNGFHGFNIFKDDKHVMYSDGNGNRCSSIYYSIPASGTFVELGKPNANA